MKIEGLTLLTHEEIISTYGGGSGVTFLGVIYGTYHNFVTAVGEALTNSSEGMATQAALRDFQ